MTYTFDKLNRLATATDPATGTPSYTYDNVGNLNTITYPNGTIAEYTYDALNRLTYLENRTSDGTVISSYAYTLDAAGNRTKVVEHTGRTVEYTYDDTDKLLEEKITNPDSSTSVISYTYDAVGNRLTKTENGFTTTYQYNENNQLVKEDDITYSYDDNGNLKEKNSAEETVEYFYDAENHLARVETTRFGVTIVVEYEYDADGNRVRKVIDGTIVTNYLVDANRGYAQVLEEQDGNGDLLVRYVYGHDLISQTHPSTGSGRTVSYYHYDGLGSTRALTASSEAVTDTYNYDAFGNLLDKTGSTTNTYLFTGEFFDANIGFYYLRARYMDPNVGRFVTMDPFSGLFQDPYSLHKYLYANANPINMSDPSGYLLSLTTIGQKGIAFIQTMLSRIQVFALKTISPEKLFIRALYGGLKGGLTSWSQGKSFTQGFTRGALRGAIYGAFINNFYASVLLEEIERITLDKIADVVEWLQQVNPDFPAPGTTHNCVYCAIAFDYGFRGIRFEAPRHFFGKEGSEELTYKYIEDVYGREFRCPVYPDTITSEIRNSGPGARGIVLIIREKANHVINVVNVEGTVRFFDAQMKREVKLEDYQKHGTVKGWALLRTD